jgi:hypothetical protein
MKLFKHLLILTLTMSLAASCAKKEEDAEEDDPSDDADSGSLILNVTCQSPASHCDDNSADGATMYAYISNVPCDDFTGDESQTLSYGQASVVCDSGVCTATIDNDGWEGGEIESGDAEAIYAFIDTDASGDNGASVGEPVKCSNFGDFPMEEGESDEYTAEFSIDADQE